MRHWVCQAIFQNSYFLNGHFKFQNNLQFLRIFYIAFFIDDFILNDLNWINKKVKKLYVTHAHYALLIVFIFPQPTISFYYAFYYRRKMLSCFLLFFFLLRKIIFQKCLKSVRILRNVSGEGG